MEGPAIDVNVRLFAMLKEQAGSGQVDVSLEAGSTARDALAAVGEQVGITELLRRMPVALAINRELVKEDAILNGGDELAVIPPVSGGAGAGPLLIARITDQPLSADRLMREVAHDGAGAIVTFQGTTRTVSRLEYEAYDEMALEQLEVIVREVAMKHKLLAIAAEHRTGAVPLGEASVIVAVSSPHRPEAFDGAREAIDRIKAELPVWKREVQTDDGGEAANWVEGTPLDSPLGQVTL